MWKSPIPSFDLWKTASKLWKSCGENVEKGKFSCGNGVEFVGKTISFVNFYEILVVSQISGLALALP